MREPGEGVTEVKTAGEATEKGKAETKKTPGANEVGDAGDSDEAGGGRDEAGGGWRHPVSTAVAISSVTDEARLAEREHERCLQLLVTRFAVVM